MKLKKIISALLVATMVISMSVVALATGSTQIYFGQAEYVENENVIVNVFLREDVTKIDGNNVLTISYGADAYNFVSGTSSVSTATVTEVADGIIQYQDAGTAEIANSNPTAPFITMEFEVADPAKVADVPFEVVTDETADFYTNFGLYFGDPEESVFIMSDYEKQYVGSMTVTKKAPVTPEPPVEEEPEAGDIKTEETVLSENKKFLEIYDNNTQPRYVAIEEKSDVAVTATTVLKATYNGTTKQANLYNLLGVDEEARGNITIGKLTIKMVLPLNSAQPTDSIFNFVIQ